MTHSIDPHALQIGDVPADPRADEEHIRQLAVIAGRALDRSIGYPGNQAFSPPPITPLLGRLLNNAGDPAPYDGGRFRGLNTLGHEWEVVRYIASLAGADPDAVIGHITTGGSAANRWGILQARRFLARQGLRGAAVYASGEAHVSVAEVADELGLPLCLVPAGADGGMDTAMLAAAVAARPAGQGVIVVATDGTTMRGGRDDVEAIRAVLLDGLVDEQHLWIHLDAALNGVITPFTRQARRRMTALGAGVSSFMVSGHKMTGCPEPVAVAVAVADRIEILKAAEYLGGTNTTGVTSRSGLLAVTLWVTLRGLGTAGLRARARASLAAAADAERRLACLGLRPFRAPESIIVEFDNPDAGSPAPDGDPAETVCGRWNLARQGGRVHIVLVPSAIPQLGAFCGDVAAATARQREPCA